MPSTAVDYLNNNAAALKDALAVDAESTRKLSDALRIFGEQEQKTKELIRVQLESESQKTA